MPTHNNVPVTESDEVFPALTTVLPSTLPGGGVGGAQSSAVSAALRDVLGWRPRRADPKGFLAALNSSFGLQHVEGHVQGTYTPRGFALQADLGAVSGGQASLFARARAALEQMQTLLDGLSPLAVASDPDDCEAFRSLVRDELARVVDELGTPGGPRVARVDSYLHVLVGWTEQSSTEQSSTEQSSTEQSSFDTSPDRVSGQLGALRDRFGLVNSNVNTVEDEKIRTAFWTLSDLVTDLAQSWSRQRVQFTHRAQNAGFLGTDLVHISRALAAADDQVSEFEAILDSVFIPKSERQTIWLRRGHLTLDDLLSWLHTFLAEEGKRIVTEGGRDGIQTSFTPVLRSLVHLVEANLRPVCLPREVAETLLPLEGKLPPGMYAGRTRVAVSNLGRLLKDLVLLSSRITRYDRPTLLDVDAARGQQAEGRWRIEARVAQNRPGLSLRLQADGHAASGTETTSDADTITALFDLGDWPSVGEATLVLLDEQDVEQDSYRFVDYLSGSAVERPPGPGPGATRKSDRPAGTRAAADKPRS